MIFSSEKIICKQCGEEADKYKNFQYNKPQLFCGWECYKKWMQENPKLGENNLEWKGNLAGYTSKHGWVYLHFGKANKCENLGCNKESIAFDWHSISGEHKRERSDWMMLCRSCHGKYDKWHLKRERNKYGQFIGNCAVNSAR